MKKRVAFHTLGCKLNFSESSTLARQFTRLGFETISAKSDGEPDVIVLNTCAVTAEAEKKCRTQIRHLHRLHPSAVIVVTGCYAQLRADELAAIEGVGLVVGNNAKGSLVERAAALTGKLRQEATDTCSETELQTFFAAFSAADRTRAFLKVQDGCSYHCAYCTIPAARGESRNIAIADLVGQAGQIALSGQREIVLTGVNIGDFGRTTGETFLDLLRALDTVEGIDRYRISSIEPNLLTDAILEFCQGSRKFMPHFHIPLQAGTDKILGLMRRRYTTAIFAERLAAVRRIMGDAFVGIDVIVGFPGETAEDFAATEAFLTDLNPAFLHVFPYSIRPGTVAAEMEGQVAPAEKQRRVARLNALSDRLHAQFAQQFVGKSVNVLWESSQKGGQMFGFTEHYIKVTRPYDRALVNQITTIVLEQGDIVV